MFIINEKLLNYKNSSYGFPFFPNETFKDIDSNN